MLCAAFQRRFAKLYTRTHEWIELAGAIGTVGITSYGAHHLGEIVAVSVRVGREVKKGGELGDIESVKLTAPIIAPMSGKVIEVNRRVVADPTLVNTSAEQDGWIAKLQVADPAGASALMDAAAYKVFLDPTKG
jgi:glycine cleavage system H protein